MTEKDNLSTLVQQHSQQIADATARAEDGKRLERNLCEERSRYQTLLGEHRQLQERYTDLKEEMSPSWNRTNRRYRDTWTRGTSALYQGVGSPIIRRCAYVVVGAADREVQEESTTQTTWRNLEAKVGVVSVVWSHSSLS
ncbi:hypothetical protein UPYG_G00206380 [Umbra pygmaea]|uniref:Uncharacterized protein n=1 Tax=Umbra pygmaea TaxID=75934 RepID=A0ABD0WK26_UMBPY